MIRHYNTLVKKTVSALGAPFPLSDKQSLTELYMVAPRAATEAMHILGYTVPIEALLECVAYGRIEHFEAILRGATIETDVLLQLLQAIIEHDKVHFLVYMSQRMDIVPHRGQMVDWVRKMDPESHTEILQFFHGVGWMEAPEYSEDLVPKLQDLDRALSDHPHDQKRLEIHDYRFNLVWNQVLSEGTIKDMYTIHQMVIRHGLFYEFHRHTLQAIRFQEIILNDTAVRFMMEFGYLHNGDIESLETLIIYGSPHPVQTYLRSRVPEPFNQREVDLLYARMPVGKLLVEAGEDGILMILRVLYDMGVVPNASSAAVIRNILHAWLRSVLYEQIPLTGRTDTLKVFQQFHCYYILPKHGEWRPAVFMPEVGRTTLLGEWMLQQGYLFVSTSTAAHRIKQMNDFDSFLDHISTGSV